MIHDLEGGTDTASMILFDSEALPDDVAGLVRPVGEVERFRVVGGRLHFSRVEYGFRRDDSQLAKSPSMGGSCEVPPGMYLLRVYHMEYPGGLVEERLRGKACGSTR